MDPGGKADYNSKHSESIEQIVFDSNAENINDSPKDSEQLDHSRKFAQEA
jgi:hypothetical protein